MGGHCKICGRRLVTGRKYCYEHRNSASGEQYRKDKLIATATKEYKRIKLGWFWLSIYRYWYAFVILSGIMIFWFYPIAIVFIFIMMVFMVLKIIVNFKLRYIQKRIDYREDNDYNEFVREWSALDREDKEYKKYLTE